ncbi:MAG: TGS domain-containing protein, partial [Candidatus Bathyarchaeia archaeon]
EERLSGLAIRRAHIFEAIRRTGLNAEKPTSWSDEDLVKFLDTLRRIAKPMLIAANKIDVEPAEENLERLKSLDYIVVPSCAEAELALRRAAEKKLIDYKPGDCNFNILEPNELTETQRKALRVVKEKILQKFGSTGVQDAINMAFFQLLNMIVVYPVEDIERLSDHRGRVLPDAFIVPYGTTARQLAYTIHTELGESFIYAVEARERKRIGENHVLKDRDVVSIVSAKKRA